jgi:hypothetical protein
MIRRVTAHIFDVHKNQWRVHLLCRHVVLLAKDDHSRKVKARHCPTCPGAALAEMADLKNEIEERRIAARATEPAIDLPKVPA